MTAAADAVEQRAGDAGADGLARAQLVLLAHGEQGPAPAVLQLEDERPAAGQADPQRAIHLERRGAEQLVPGEDLLATGERAGRRRGRGGGFVDRQKAGVVEG